MGHQIDAVQDELDRLRKLNAELLAACEGFLHHIRVLRNEKMCLCDLCNKTRKTIAEAKETRS